MDMSIHSGFAVLELNKLLMYKTYYDKLQPYFGRQIYNYNKSTVLVLHWVIKLKVLLMT